MNIKIKLISFEDYQILINEFKGETITFYNSVLWLKHIIKSFNINIVAVATFDNEERLLSITPFAYKKKFIFKLYGSPLSGLFTLYMGPIFKKDISNGLKSEILQLQNNYLMNKAHYIEYGIDQMLGKWQISEAILLQNSFQLIQRPTYMIDLAQGEEFVWENFKSRARNMIRKAEKNNVTVSAIKADKQWITNFYDMLTETYKKQNKEVPHNKNFYQNLIELQSSESIEFYSAFHDSKIISSAIFLINNNKKIYMSGTSSLIGMKYAANTLIQWCSMTDAISKGIAKYDLGGLGVAKIDKFKESFGGKLYYDTRWVYKNRFVILIEPIIKIFNYFNFFKIKIGE